MHIEWNKVTWYSKLIAVVLFVIVLFVGFKLGEIYQQAKDYSSTYSTYLQPVSPASKATSTVSGGGTMSCVSNIDCPSGYYCSQPGPIVAGKPTSKVCTPDSQATPM